MIVRDLYKKLLMWSLKSKYKFYKYGNSEVLYMVLISDNDPKLEYTSSKEGIELLKKGFGFFPLQSESIEDEEVIKTLLV